MCLDDLPQPRLVGALDVDLAASGAVVPGTACYTRSHAAAFGVTPTVPFGSY